MGMESSHPPTTPVMALVPPGAGGHTQRRDPVVDRRISLRRYGAGLLVVVIDTVQPILMAQGVVRCIAPPPVTVNTWQMPAFHQAVRKVIC